MAKTPVAAAAPGARPIQTAPMPANIAKPPARSTVTPIDPPAPNPDGEADSGLNSESAAGSEVQNQPTDEERAAAAATPEGQEAARILAEQANQDAANEGRKITERVIANAKIEPLSPATAFPGEETITMIAPRDFFVLLQDGRRVQFKKGPQEVCASLQTHKYVLDHGVKPYTK